MLAVADPSAMAEEYNVHGYVILKNLIPSALIDDVVTELERVKKRRGVVYYSLSVHRWIKPRLSSHSYWIDSVENPSWHVHLPGLRQAIMRVLYHENVSNALSSMTGRPSFISWQDMLFDRSVGTIDHHDSLFLDT